MQVRVKLRTTCLGGYTTADVRCSRVWAGTTYDPKLRRANTPDAEPVKRIGRSLGCSTGRDRHDVPPKPSNTTVFLRLCCVPRSFFTLLTTPTLADSRGNVIETVLRLCDD